MAIVESAVEMQESLDSILEEVNAEMGNALMYLEGTSGLWPLEHRIPTGSIALDMAIGIGGLPRGKMVQFHGPYSSGKSTMALLAIANAQQQGLPAVYIDAEYALDPTYMAKLGVDVSRLLVNQPPHLEAAIDTAVATMNTGKVGIVVIDSVPALRSQYVMDNDAETETRMLEARRWTAQIPRMKRAAKDNHVTLLIINQLRAPGQYQPASMDNVPGGTALQFAMDLMVKFERKVESSEVKTDEALAYQQTNFKIMKNKVGSPFKGGHFFILTDDQRERMGIDRHEEILLQAVAQGIILEDMNFRDGDGEEPVSKKGWFSMHLTKEDVALIQQDAPDVPDDATYTEAFRFPAFIEKLSEWPTFLLSLEDKIYELLNRGDKSVDPNAEDEYEHQGEEAADDETESADS